MNRPISNDELLEILQKPVFITQGIEKQIVLSAHAQYNAGKVKNDKTSYYEKVGHIPFWENSARFNGELREFVILLD